MEAAFTDKVRNFEDLAVWQRARELALAVYSCSRAFPREEIYGLTSQLRRASVSIGCNIAEGSKRRTTNDLCHFLNIAEGSTEEVKFLLMLAQDLGYIENATQIKLLNHAEAIGAMLNNLIR